MGYCLQSTRCSLPLPFVPELVAATCLPVSSMWRTHTRLFTIPEAPDDNDFVPRQKGPKGKKGKKKKK